MGMTIYEAFYAFVGDTLAEEKITEPEKDKQLERIRSGLDLADIFLSDKNGAKE